MFVFQSEGKEEEYARTAYTCATSGLYEVYGGASKEFEWLAKKHILSLCSTHCWRLWFTGIHVTDNMTPNIIILLIY